MTFPQGFWGRELHLREVKGRCREAPTREVTCNGCCRRRRNHLPARIGNPRCRPRRCAVPADRLPVCHRAKDQPATATLRGRLLRAAPMDGLDPAIQMGPLANHRRIETMEAMVADATAKGARLLSGRNRIGNRGYFYPLTVLADVPDVARAMRDEPRPAISRSTTSWPRLPRLRSAARRAATAVRVEPRDLSAIRSRRTCRTSLCRKAYHGVGAKRWKP